MTSRLLVRALSAYAVVVAIAALSLHRWLLLDSSRAPRGPYVVTAWRDGSRTARSVVSSRPESALAAERAIPGTTVVVERVVDEARALVGGPLSFALSFRPGRDGVHAIFRGRDAYLTRDDLVHDRLYRSAHRIGRLDFGRRLDVGSVLVRLARELHADRKELWREGTFRRFVSARSVAMNGSAQEKQEPLTPNALATSAKRLALFLGSRVDSNGLLATRGLVRPGARYDWSLHARAVGVLADAARLVDDPKLRVAARRAVRRLNEETSRCDGHACIGRGDAVETIVSVEAIEAYAKMAGPMRAQAFIEAIGPLAEFVRSQQRSGGDIASGYDVRGQKATERHDEQTTELTARAVQALTLAYALGRDEANLAAAQRGVAALVRTERLLPDSRSSLAWSGICTALGDVARRGAPSLEGLGRCTRWALGVRDLQARGDVPDLEGGFAAGLFETPATVPTALFTLGISGALEFELGRGKHDEDVVRALALEVAKALAFLDRQLAPGDRGYTLAPPSTSFGGVAEGPLTSDVSLDATVSAASAMLGYLSLMEQRDPARRKFNSSQKKAPPPVAF